MWYVLAVLCIFSTTGCSDDKTEEERLSAVVKGTTQAEEVDWQGGPYTIKVDYEPATRAVEPWSYRMTVDGIVQETVEVTEQSDELTVYIPANYTEQVREIVVEVRIPRSQDDTPKWKKAVWVRQKSALVAVGGVYWAKANLMERDGKFIIGDSPAELGLYFKYKSTYGVPSEGTSYAGTAYNPASTTVSLAAIPQADGDPCALATGGQLRLPSRGELSMLFYFNLDGIGMLNGVKGVSFGSGRLFLPFAGSCDEETGEIGYKNRNGGYWTDSDDGDGHGYILAMNSDDLAYSDLYPSYGTGMGSVRCVRNKAKAAYVSHSPGQTETNDAFEVAVETNPGVSTLYFVELRDVANNSGPYTGYVEAASGDYTASVTVPKNNQPQDVTYEIYIDGEPTGKTVLQGRKRDYVEYRSHSPRGTVPADAFTLSVTCETDLDMFDVEVKSGGETIAKASGSKDNPIVELAIPANEGVERALEIWVNGVDTRNKVTQEKPVKLMKVIWSPGYLTVKEGVYTFAGEQELGMFFKFRSRYGLTLDKAPASTAKYSGTAYGPQPEQKTYAEVPVNDVDPCSLIADGNTWRMPTQEDWDDLLFFDYAWEMNKYRAYTDGEQTVYLTPSGSIKNTGSGMLVSSYVRVWSSTPDGDKIFVLNGGLSSRTSVFKPTSAGVTPEIAMMVRCVRAK